MKLRVLNSADVHRALPMADAIASSREAFTALAAGTVAAPPRVHLVEDDRTTLLMGAASGDVGRIAKVVNVFPGNRDRDVPVTNGLVLVLDPQTGVVQGLCCGATVTAIRTGAVAGLATDLLARPDARVGAVIGAGAQARTQLLAMTTVRALEQVRVFAPREDRVAELLAEMKDQVDCELVAAASSKAAVAEADVVSLATSTTDPAVVGGDLAAGVHINGVGSFRLDMRELDVAAVARCDRIVVDLRESALHEAGELVAAQEAGATSSEQWLELGDLLRDPTKGRARPTDVTFFKSVGHAVQDLFAAGRAIANARQQQLGQSIEL